jgi:hypothetical protein
MTKTLNGKRWWTIGVPLRSGVWADQCDGLRAAWRGPDLAGQEFPVLSVVVYPPATRPASQRIVGLLESLPTAGLRLYSSGLPPSPGTTPSTLAATRIRKFIDECRKMRGLDPQCVYRVHAGDSEREASITIDDLEELTLCVLSAQGKCA